MTHQSLYRKYRPATFDDVVGQQHVERTLRNAVAESKVAHAYLFTGPRGTGKTTTARLLAKALLCERGPGGEPDGTCASCADVAEGTHPDVLEIDAASNTGVDLIRANVIDRVKYAPTRGQYKVYIIDEVHMLSSASFNAILKTLEEPPSHVVFVLCTTHPQKVPETIHSRCQRFDFHRISVEEIADHLRYICESEGFRVDKGAITLIAKHADGGMRDAITVLEQLAAFTGGEITVDDVEGLVGEVDSAQLFAAAGLVARRDIAGCFRWVAETVETGTDLSELVRALTGHVRDLYVVASTQDATGVIDRPGDEMALLSAQASEFGGPDRIGRLLSVLGELASEMRWSSDPRLSLEVALTRMANPRGEMTIEALAERIEALERGLPASPEAPAVREAPATAAPAVSSEPQEDEDAAEPVVKPVSSTGPLDRGTAKRSWLAVLAELKRRKSTRAHTFAQVEVDVDEDGRTLVIEFPDDQEFSLKLAEEPEMRELLRSGLAAVFGTAPPFRYQLGRGAIRPGTEASAPDAASCVDFEPVVQPDAQPPSDDLMSVLEGRLGATIVAEHPATPDGEDI